MVVVMVVIVVIVMIVTVVPPIHGRTMIHKCVGGLTDRARQCPQRRPRVSDRVASLTNTLSRPPRPQWMTSLVWVFAVVSLVVVVVSLVVVVVVVPMQSSATGERVDTERLPGRHCRDRPRSKCDATSIDGGPSGTRKVRLDDRINKMIVIVIVMIARGYQRPCRVDTSNTLLRKGSGDTESPPPS